MKVRFFGGPWHRKKVDVQLIDPLIIAEPRFEKIRYNWHNDDGRLDVVGVKNHHYRLHKVQGENQTFTFYVHEDSSIDEILKKALT